MGRPQVVVDEADVAAGHLERRRTVAEDALQAEDITTIREEGPGERVAEDMWRAPVADLRIGGQATDELLDRPSRDSHPTSAHEQRQSRVEAAPSRQPPAERSAAPATDRHEAFARALASHETATLDEVDVADAQGGQFGEPDARIQQERDDRLVAQRLARARGRGKQGSHLVLPKRRYERVGDLGRDQPGERMGREADLATDPTAEGSDGPRSTGERARR